MKLNRKSILNNIKARGVVLFGAGDFAGNFYRDFKDDLNVKYCISNNPIEKIFQVDGSEVCPVYRVEDMINGIDSMIIICARLYADMMAQLNASGLRYGYEYIDEGVYRILMSEKKVAVFYGACYMRALCNCLTESVAFTSRYSSFYFLNYHKLQSYDHERLLILLSIADLYICHETMDAKGIAYRNQLKKSCLVMRVPLVTFNGYYPRASEKIGSNNVYSIIPGGTSFGTFMTPDDNVNQFIREGMDINEIIKIISNEDFYEHSYLEHNFHKEIRKIQLSEMRSDVIISDYIEEHNGKKRLFLNEKHMSNFVLLELARRMLAFLELPVQLPEERLLDRQLLYTTEVPIYPSVIKKLSLRVYGDNPKYRLFTFGHEIDVTFEEYMLRYYDYCMMMKKCMEEGYFLQRDGI